jgi:hypothetical protein
MSCAEMASTTLGALRLMLIARSTEARMPVTMISGAAA